ncbi:hypothetical protein OWM54_08275 [Myxococcus sp. MISCRS1]|jgi:hypothetical protein|nr:hypothetical protein [Myxococcus sp. MISCRS1]MCY0997139.1 hypothetical protein [Myxococcus sp. MISCRS1]BDT32843.1 hypothetical protein MFMH1_25120 [Myxococcus sp. MH1]
MADPDIHKEHDELFFLSGTGNGWQLPIHETRDLTHLHPHRLPAPGLQPEHPYRRGHVQ